MVIISIIVPVYKVEKYLKRCVMSLVNQTLKDMEIILVDDNANKELPPSCGVCPGGGETDSLVEAVQG